MIRQIIYQEDRAGPITDPCGAPGVTGAELEGPGVFPINNWAYLRFADMKCKCHNQQIFIIDQLARQWKEYAGEVVRDVGHLVNMYSGTSWHPF